MEKQTYQDYYSRLRTIAKRLNRIVVKVNKELQAMNCYHSIGVSAGMHSFELAELSTDELHELVEHLIAEEEALGVETEEIYGIMARYWLRIREEKKKATNG
jgi:hypothetical protein